MTIVTIQISYCFYKAAHSHVCTQLSQDNTQKLLIYPLSIVQL